MIASNKCYQLSLALYTMSAEIPYEDVQTAAASLIQCATNILTVIESIIINYLLGV